VASAGGVDAALGVAELELVAGAEFVAARRTREKLCLALGHDEHLVLEHVLRVAAVHAALVNEHGVRLIRARKHDLLNGQRAKLARALAARARRQHADERVGATRAFAPGKGRRLRVLVNAAGVARCDHVLGGEKEEHV
jgi:hypothetical protein